MHSIDTIKTLIKVNYPNLLQDKIYTKNEKLSEYQYFLSLLY